jgi:uracil-DNA glycosylase
MDLTIEESWRVRLRNEFGKPYFENLMIFVNQAYKTSECYPPLGLIFNAFDRCTFEKTCVVILGQDPYHGPRQANGLSFSVNDGVAFPPSLINIFKELNDDLGVPFPKNGNLERWAEQGVLLLNSTLTVQASSAGSHQNKGWEQYTDAVIRCVNEEKEDVVFLLWGKYAQDKGKIIDKSKHLVLKSKHPSPMSANFGGWFGNKHFSQTNNYLRSKGLAEVEW